MNCKMISHDRLLDYADKRLPADEAEAICRHLDLCRHCRRLFDEATMLSSAIKESPELTGAKAITPEMDLAVFAEIRKASARMRRKSRKTPWRVILAYAAAVLISIVMPTIVILSLKGVERRNMEAVASHRQPTAETLRPIAPIPNPPTVAVTLPAPAAVPKMPGKIAPLKVRGDINGDGVVDIADAMLLQQAILGEAVSSLDPANSDVNGDQRIDILDIREIATATLATAGG